MNMRIESLEVMNHLQAGMEVGSTELKRQSDQAKRFGNEGYKTHPQLNGVKGAVQSLQPDQLLKVLKNTQQALGGNGGTTRVDEQAMPQLQAPTSGSTRTSDGPKLSASATMTKLLAEISQLTAESTLTNLITKLEGLKAMMEGANGAYGRLAGELEQLGEAWANASDALKEAQQQAKELSQDVDKAQSALESAREKLSNLEAEERNRIRSLKLCKKRLMLRKRQSALLRQRCHRQRRPVITLLRRPWILQSRQSRPPGPRWTRPYPSRKHCLKTCRRSNKARLNSTASRLTSRQNR